ncbi:MAG TPA: tetratricopeptide repeat protein [bacterium]|nr:tetratricopeptide repeat protein [bacterium]
MTEKPQENSSASPRRLAFAVVLVFVLAYGLYLIKLGNFFTFDDGIFIRTDLSLRGWSNLAQQFVSDQNMLYRPLRSAAYGILIHFFGIESPLPFHLTGLFFHAAISALVVLIVWLLLGDLRAAVLAGMIFAWHPAHTDRAVPLTASFDLLGLMLAYGSWALALAYDRFGKSRYMVGAVLSLLAACLSSEEAVMALPLIVGSFLLLPGERKRRLSLTIMLAGIVLWYLLTRSQVLGGLARTQVHAAGSLYNTLWTMPVVFWRYVGLLFFPVGLSPAYSPTIHTGPAPLPLVALSGLAALLVAMILARRRAPALTIGIGWLLLGLFPFANILPGDTLMAERYLYASLGGFALAMGALISRTALYRRQVIYVFVALLLVYGAGTIGRCLAWGQPLQLWGQAAQREPESFLANLNAGYHLVQANRLDEAESLLHKAAQLQSNRAEPLLSLGEIAYRRNDAQQALDLFRQATQADPDYCSAYSGLAQMYVLTGQMMPAAEAVDRALACDPDEPMAHYIAGYLFVLTGQCEAARPHLLKVIGMQPRVPQHESALELLAKCP